MANIDEIKRRADIRDVWSALGGGKLLRGRGQAFWRDGDGYSVALDFKKNVWYDHVGGSGGDVIALVRTALQCSFADATDWVSRHIGVPVSKRTQEDQDFTGWEADLRAAIWWKIAARLLFEWALDELPSTDPDRRVPTQLLATVRHLSGAALVNEYRQRRHSDPKWTAGMVHAGRLHDARVQRRLAHWIRRTYGPTGL
jgi:hypothetical protein